jgi:hypothetical protein
VLVDRPVRQFILAVAVISLVGACASFGTPTATPGPSATPVATPSLSDQSLWIAEAWIAAASAKDADQLVSLYAPDAVWDDASMNDHFVGGATAVHAGWDPVLGVPGIEFKDFRVAIHGDDGATVMYTTFGPSGPFTRMPFEVKLVSVLEIQGELITHETVYYDTAAILP